MSSGACKESGTHSGLWSKTALGQEPLVIPRGGGWDGMGGLSSRWRSGVVSEEGDSKCLPVVPSSLHVPVTQELGTGTCDI